MPTLWHRGFRRYRKQRLETWIALAAVVTGFMLLLPWTHDEFSEASIKRAFGPADYVWSIAYFAGGLLTIYGILKENAKKEGYGLIVLEGALMIRMIAVVNFAGLRGITSSFLTIALMVVIGDKIYELFQDYHLARRHEELTGKKLR
jgi:hypothetical protein